MNHIPSSVQHSGAQNIASAASSDAKPRASEADHAMYLGMMALLEGIGRSERVGASLADMSTTLYETLVTNGTKRIEDLQDELETLGYLIDNWDSYQGYLKWANKMDDLKSQIAELEAKPSLGYGDRLKLQALKSELSSTEANPPPKPPIDPDKEEHYKELVKTYGRKSGFRAYVNGVSQQLSVENQAVLSNKKLPDTLQAQVKAMVTNQSIFSSRMTSMLRLIQRQLQH